MKRLLAAALLLCLLLAACASPEVGPSLVGTWVNEGQYSEGRDFVETLTLTEEGGILVQLDYQGRPYATLEGVWSAGDGVLRVDFADPDTRDRVYSYTVTETSLVLTGDGKDVEYVRR